MKRINITLFSLMLVGILFSCTKASLNYTQNGNWVSRATFPGVPSGAAASFVINNTAYVGTGINPQTPNVRLKTMFQYTAAPISTASPTGYDSALGAWGMKQIPDFPGAPRSNAVGFAVAGKGYIGTGIGNDGFTVYADFYSYDPNAQSWSQVDSIHDSLRTYPRKDAAAFGFDNSAYVLTGTDLNYFFSDVWKYDPAANKWTKMAYLPGSARAGAVTWVYNGLGYLVTGRTPGSTWSLNNMCYDFWRYDPSKPDSTAWKRLRDIANTSSATYDDGYTNIVRELASGFVIKGTANGDKGYLTCGANGTSYSFTWEYDFASDLWTQKTPYEGGARVNAVGFTIKNRGFVGTGLPSAAGGGTGFTDLREFFPDQVYNQFD
jgi:N-acetylneuraminic acid mutarotase